MMQKKLSSPSCERNKLPILKVLREILSPDIGNKLMEVGSGTGQHAAFFAKEFSWIEWTVTDRLENHSCIEPWLSEAKLNNVIGPIEFEIGKSKWPSQKYDYIFCANVLHIISWDYVLKLFNHIGSHSLNNTQLIFYGPFNYNGEFTSESNKDFDFWLKNRDSKSGIRDFEKICAELNRFHFQLVSDYKMPANNHILHFKLNETIQSLSEPGLILKL